MKQTSNTGPFVPAGGSQPETVNAEMPRCSEAARRSQPAALRDAVATLLPEVRRRKEFFKNTTFTFRYVHYRELEASLVELNFSLTEETQGPPAGNDQEEPRRK